MTSTRAPSPTKPPCSTSPLSLAITQCLAADQTDDQLDASTANTHGRRSPRSHLATTRPRRPSQAERPRWDRPARSMTRSGGSVARRRRRRQAARPPELRSVNPAKIAANSGRPDRTSRRSPIGANPVPHGRPSRSATTSDECVGLPAVTTGAPNDDRAGLGRCPKLAGLALRGCYGR